MHLSQVPLSLLSTVEPSDFEEWLDFAATATPHAGKRKCVKATAFPCGNTCLPSITKTGKSTNCKKALTGQAKDHAGWLKVQAERHLLRDQGNSALKKVATVVPKAKDNEQTENIHISHEQFSEAGKQFLKDFEAEIKACRPTASEISRKKALVARQDKLKAEHALLVKTGASRTEKDKKIREIQHNEKQIIEEKEQSNGRIIASFENIRKAIGENTPLTKKEATDLANRVKFDDSFPEDKKSAIRQDLADFFYLTGGKGATSLKKIEYTRDRAYALSSGEVNIGSSFSKRALWHETGHHLEFESKDIEKAAGEWIKHHATSAEPKKLSELTGNENYSDREKALPDSFINPYVGKIYPSGSTEVISMGIERFTDAKSMATLYLKDRKHFEFIIGVLLSKKQK